jgi:hypothetical protein
LSRDAVESDLEQFFANMKVRMKDDRYLS